MASPTLAAVPGGRRGLALIGLAGALLSGLGDVLILGRAASGRDFDQANGRVPPQIDPDPRWRSLWNGAALPVGRVQAGSVIGNVGIGLLQWLALHGLSRSLPPGRERTIATASAAAFAVSGVLTHQGCATVILAYRRAAEASAASDSAQPSPRSATPLLAVGATGTLGALAAFSASQTVAALRNPSSSPVRWSAVTPFPCVLATLLGFGRLPGPVGGFARPASISTGLLTYFAITAASRGTGPIRHS